MKTENDISMFPKSKSYQSVIFHSSIREYYDFKIRFFFISRNLIKWVNQESQNENFLLNFCWEIVSLDGAE